MRALTQKQVDRAKRIADKYIARDGSAPRPDTIRGESFNLIVTDDYGFIVASRGPHDEVVTKRCYSMEDVTAQLEKGDRS